MSVKVSYLRLGMDIPDFTNNAGKVAHTINKSEMNYVDKSEVIKYVKHNSIKTGLSLSTYENYLIVSTGYYTSNNVLVKVTKPFTYKFNSNDAEVIGSIDGQDIYKIWIYHDGSNFVVQNFETTSMKYIGTAEYCDNHWTMISPIEDLATSFKHRFLLSEIRGKNGFRVYSDGWKEQWGYGSNPTFYITFNTTPTLVTNGATNVTQKGMTRSQGYWYAEGY